jgi:hypothetical protein
MLAKLSRPKILMNLIVSKQFCFVSKDVKDVGKQFFEQQIIY